MGSALSVTRESGTFRRKSGLVHQKQRTFRRTFDVGRREDQLLDLRGPWHGRQHLEGLLAVNLLAAADAEL